MFQLFIWVYVVFSLRLFSVSESIDVLMLLLEHG